MLRLLMLTLLVACGTSAGERKALTAEQQEKLAKLVTNLGDTQFEVRQVAQQEIMKFGRRAVVTLEKFKDSDDAEIAHRVMRIIAEIEKRSNPVDSALAWLAKTQETDGHWDSVKHGSKRNADIEHTSLALLAFLGAGHTEKVGEHKGNVRDAVAWLSRNQRADGAIMGAGEKEVDGLTHALAALALCEAASMANIPETKVFAQKATDYSVTIHQSETGFGTQAASKAPDLLTTTFFAIHLKSAKVAGLRVQPHESFDKIIRFLDQTDDVKQSTFRDTPGGETSVRMTIMGTLSRQFLGWKKEDLRPYAEAISKTFTPTADGPKSDMLSNYIGTLVMFQQGGELWTNWTGPFRSKLHACQRDDDEFDGSWDPSGEWLGGGRVAATALCALGLEVYYRYQLFQE